MRILNRDKEDHKMRDSVFPTLKTKQKSSRSCIMHDQVFILGKMHNARPGTHVMQDLEPMW